jgi:DMSO/TMAO reductase YedYZ molybdopterin-dependent catalytic subunit
VVTNVSETLLRIDGEVEQPRELTFEDLESIDDSSRIIDVSQVDLKRKGTAVKLAAVLDLIGVKTTARYLGLHGTLDNFHASIPLEPVREQGLLIYQLDGKPLEPKAGGPIRFLIPDYAACHTDEIDECANVKFVDHIELTAEKGFDNRPEDDEEHERLHREQS